MKFASSVDQYNAFILDLFDHRSFDTPDAWQGNVLYVVLRHLGLVVSCVFKCSETEKQESSK